MIFKPDIFSNKIPIWNRLDNIDLFFNICDKIPNIYISDISEVFCSGTFEINSSNFKIKSKNGSSILLKKWPLGTKKNKVEKIQRLTNWLFDKKNPVPYAGSFKDNNKTLVYNKSLWSYNLFNNGNYYSGQNNELESVAKITGKLAQSLIELPLDLMPDSGPLHLSEDDNFIINEMSKKQNMWEAYFGTENAKLLNTHWSYICETWGNLYNKKFYTGPVFTSHFDMHPHNLIVNDGEIVAVLDFDSCKKIPIGISLAFNALKQCRQFISNNKVPSSFEPIKNNYLQNLSTEFLFEDLSKYDFLSLSKIEVMRRICLIFRINLIDNNPNWNHVFPIQLSHLYESDKLFNL
jgi:hypothetical protein